MRYLIYTLLALAITVGIAVTTVPLGFVLGQLGLGGVGVGWAHTEGTLYRGRVNGVFTQQQVVGDVGLTLKPMSLLGGGLGYDIDMGGAGLRGTADVTLRPGQLVLQDVRARQSIAALEGLAAPIRAMGGEVRVTDADAVFDIKGCKALIGTVTSDALTRAAGQYGKVFGPVSGPLSCEDGLVVADLASDSPDGDVVRISGRFGIDGQGDVRVDVETSDPAMAAFLSQANFSFQDDVWTYAYSARGGL